jgi:hypothetical protein
MTVNRRWMWSVLAALLVVGVVGCSDDKPKRSDVDDASLIVYPGATVEFESWTDEESGRYIDGDRFNKRGNLTVNFQLAEPETVGEILDWATIELEAMGWKPKIVGDRDLTFARTAADGSLDNHSVEFLRGIEFVEGDDPSQDIVRSYTITYVPEPSDK